jgi:DNA invertase Pin-like site-specific DNA recombinase
MSATRYVTYRRVSTEEQGKSGLGLEAQDRDIRLYLETYSPEPWEIVGEFLEVESGGNSDRPELTKAIATAKRHRAVLLVSKLDRLSRKVSLIATLMDDPKLNLRVASMPHADKFALHIYAALAEQERDFISVRTKAALKEARARGVKLGGLRDTTMKRNEVVKAQAQARAEGWRGIVDPMHKARSSLREIAAALNSAGVRTARGGAWHPQAVARVVERLQR